MNTISDFRRDSLSSEELRAYEHDLESLRYQSSVIETGRIEGREEGREEKACEIARQMKTAGLSAEEIAGFTGIGIEKIKEL